MRDWERLRETKRVSERKKLKKRRVNYGRFIFSGGRS